MQNEHFLILFVTYYAVVKVHRPPVRTKKPLFKRRVSKCAKRARIYMLRNDMQLAFVIIDSVAIILDECRLSTESEPFFGAATGRQKNGL
jgi:hypothetical protein